MPVQRQRSARLVLRLDVLDRIGDLEEAAVRIPDAARVVDLEHGTCTDARRVDCGKQDVGVGVAEVEVAPVAGTDQIAAVAAQVIGEPDARLDVVVVLFRGESEILEPRQVADSRRLAGGVEHREVRILALIEREAGIEVVADSEINVNFDVTRQSSWKYVANCLVGMFARRIRPAGSPAKSAR